jgi:hypothetical protein
MKRSPPRLGLMSHCRPCANKEQRAKDKGLLRVANKNNRDRLRVVVFEAYGNKCACCGEKRWEFLAIDHVNGGGSKHRKIVTSPTELRRLIIKEGFPKKYRLLCHNCNSAIGWHGYCPHQRERDANR